MLSTLGQVHFVIFELLFILILCVEGWKFLKWLVK